MSTIHGLKADTSSVDVRVLKLRIIAAVNLAKKDIFGLSDPYVKVKLTESGVQVDSFKTKTIQRTLNPAWNTEFLIRLNPVQNTLLLEVFDENRVTRDDFLGQVSITLRGIPTEGGRRNIRPKDHMLKPRSSRSRVRGALRLQLSYLPVDPELDANAGDEEEPSPEDFQSFVMISEDGEGSPMTPSRSPLHPRAQSLLIPNDGDTVSLASVAPSQAPSPLPEGWDERQDETGRTYYVNHVNRTTQWERPTENNSLPPGWEEREDGNGRIYYIDHNTRVTTWERPTRQSSVEESSSDAARAQSQYLSRRPVSREDTASDLGENFEVINTGAESEAPANVRMQAAPTRRQISQDSSQEEPLPPGWARAQAPNGKVFFIDHNTGSTTWEDPRGDRAASSGDGFVSKIRDRTQELGSLPPGWEERVHTDGRIFYIDHTTHTTSWDDPRLANLSGAGVQYSGDYKRKYEQFRSRLKRPSNVPNKFDMTVRRKNIFEDSYKVVMAVKRPDLLKTRLWIEFTGESGLDYGGVSREWFFLLSKEMFNPYYGLFEYSATDNYTLQINALSGIANPDHLSYFKFIGRIAGLAAYHGRLLDGFFIRPFYKMMLEKTITLADMESVDNEYYNSLNWIRENDPECLELRFSVDEQKFGEVSEHELKRGGANIPVTEENKLEYINLVIKWRFVDRIGQQMNAIMEGFNDIVPRESIKLFDENELELLLCGIQDIDVNDWKTHSAYRNDYNANHPVIVLFWRVIYSFNNETRARLLQFVTGTSRVPMNGFAELYGSNGPQKFTIDKWGDPSQLPRAHTCFNRIDLPAYTDYDDMRHKLLLAIENAAGFEGVD